MRIRDIAKQKKRNQLLNKWRPAITHVLLDGTSDMPTLPANETGMFLEEWNRMFGAVRGDNLESLIKLAHSFRIDLYAQKKLKARGMREPLFAIITLGRMRDQTAWDKLVTLLEHPNLVLSLTSAQALMWINAKNAVDIIVPLILKRTDWPWAKVAHVLKQAPPLMLCEKLTTAIQNASSEQQVGLLRYMESSHCLQAPALLKNILLTTNDDRVTSVCLHIITDPDSVKIVRSFVSHPRWHVRMHAATALGRVGTTEDIALLLALIKDESWWVRYRAAQALVTIPGQNSASLTALRDQQTDKYARDILSQVIAEINLL